MRILSALLLSVMILTPGAAKADAFVWKDPDSGLTISFPDTWNVVHDQKSDDILTIIAPSNREDPVCKVRVGDDRRYVIFPPSLGSSVQKVAVSAPFWESYLAEYDDYTVNKVHDGRGLGRWFASYAMAGYTKHDGTVIQQRRGIMFASLYNDRAYVVECSALAPAYERWADQFKSVIKSIDFKKAYHEVPTGEYANFLKEADMIFWAGSPEASVIH